MSLCSAKAIGYNIINPSFENGLVGWTRTNIWDPAMGSGVQSYFATDGTYSLQIFSGADMSNTIGNNRGAYQNVSLTDIPQILFDVKLSSHYYGAPSVFRDYAAMFLIDGIPYWTQTVEGTYLNQIVDVSAQFGSHQIELRLECIKDENYAPSCWSEWDNLRAIPEPATLLLFGLGSLALLRKHRSEKRKAKSAKP